MTSSSRRRLPFQKPLCPPSADLVEPILAALREIDVADGPVDGEIAVVVHLLRQFVGGAVERRRWASSSGELEMISGVTASSISRLSASSTMHAEQARHHQPRGRGRRSASMPTAVCVLVRRLPSGI